MLQRALQRRKANSDTAAAVLTRRPSSLHFQAYAPCQSAEIQLQAPASTFSSPHSAPFSAFSSAAFAFREASGPQAKDQWCTANGRRMGMQMAEQGNENGTGRLAWNSSKAIQPY